MSHKTEELKFVSRAGEKLAFAIRHFNISAEKKVCADLGANAGGFTDCLLQNGATKVYCVDTGYGVLDWNLRNNPKVVPMERTNALYVKLPELVDLVTIDVGWTKQSMIIPVALKLLKPHGEIISLIKPHYEATQKLNKGKIADDDIEAILESTLIQLKDLQLDIKGVAESPIIGKKAGNKEFLAYCIKK